MLSGRQALVNNRSQHHSLIPTCKELVSLVQLCAFTLTPESPPADSEAISQSQLYSIRGLHVVLLSIFCNHIMIELAATAFTICYGY